MSETTAAPALSAPEASPARGPRWERGLTQEPAREAPAAAQPRDEGTDAAAIEAAMDGADRPVDHTGESVDEGGEGEERESAGLHRVKVDGEELEVDLDELKAGYSRNRAAQKRFKEAAELKTQVQTFVGHLRSGKPEVIENLLRKVGVDPVKVAESILTAALAEAEMPASERGMRALQREREQLERERQSWESQRGEQTIASEAQTLQRQYTQQVTSGLTASGLPVSQGMIGRVAAEMEQAIKGGYELSVRDAVALVREDMHGMAKRLSTETLAKVTGSMETAEALKRAVAGEVHTTQRREAAKPATARRQPRQPATPPPIVNPESTKSLKALFDS
jgi:hypothetical protein